MSRHTGEERIKLTLQLGANQYEAVLPNHIYFRSDGEAERAAAECTRLIFNTLVGEGPKRLFPIDPSNEDPTGASK